MPLEIALDIILVMLSLGLLPRIISASLLVLAIG